MARIRSRGTLPEIRVGVALRQLGVRYRKNVPNLPGRPDFANRRQGWVIFVHGCFWHRHIGCKRATTPKTRTDYWVPKLVGNAERDKQNEDRLRNLGLKVLVIWECQTPKPSWLRDVLRRELIANHGGLPGLDGTPVHDRPRSCFDGIPSKSVPEIDCSLRNRAVYDEGRAGLQPARPSVTAIRGVHRMTSIVPALADINIPAHVKVQTAPNFESLMAEIGRRSMMGYAGEVFFGTAFLQGSRLQFTTAMPVQKMLDVSKTDRSRKKDNVLEVTEHSNRPQEPAHAKHLRNYLLSTACTGDKFILPSFTFNYGVGLDDDAPDVTIILFASAEDGTNAWPGILLVPQGAKLDTTDGAHRRSQIVEILSNGRIGDDAKDALKRNAVDVKIVFEASRSDSHQDFADCGKAKAIPKSLVTTFDVRDRRNALSRELVKGSPFLAAYVDATASNINLSAKSRMIWSMNAIRMFVAHIVDHHPDSNLSEDEKVEGAADFFTALVRHLPQLKALDRARLERDPTVTTGSLRDIKGGDVALRGVGMAVFARAFVHCKEYEIDYDVMAAKLATINWHLLVCERGDVRPGPTFASDLFKAAQPIWAHLLVIGENRYRVSSSSIDADAAWQKIVGQLFSQDRQAA